MGWGAASGDAGGVATPVNAGPKRASGEPGAESEEDDEEPEEEEEEEEEEGGGRNTTLAGAAEVVFLKIMVQVDWTDSVWL